MYKHQPFTHNLLTQAIFMTLSTLFVLSQILFAWSCPLWVSFATASVVFFPLSNFISFRIMLRKESHMRLRRDEDYKE